jgi:hypothetical protein
MSQSHTSSRLDVGHLTMWFGSFKESKVSSSRAVTLDYRVIFGNTNGLHTNHEHEIFGFAAPQC